MTLFKNFKTYQIAKNLYQEVRVLKVPSFMRNQLDRATLSIVLNLSEGAGKYTQRDRRKFFYIALGSLREVQACLDLVESPKLKKEANKLAAHVWKLCQNPGGGELS